VQEIILGLGRAIFEYRAVGSFGPVLRPAAAALAEQQRCEHQCPERASAPMVDRPLHGHSAPLNAINIIFPREGKLWNFVGTHKIHKGFQTESSGSTGSI